LTEVIYCPACGSNNVRSKITAKSVEIPLVKSETIFVHEDICLECGEDGDFADRNDSIIEATLARMESQAIKDNLRLLSSLGFTHSYIERILGLSQGTMTGEKVGKLSKVVLALLQIIRTYPWILQVVEHDFEKEFAQTVVIDQAHIYFKTKYKVNLS
jgi:hypothetical protein